MSNSKTNIAPTVEIVGSILSSNASDSDFNSFKNDPKSCLLSHLNIDAVNFDVNVIENTSNEVSLSLPFYDSLENIQSQIMSDNDLDDASGGEIVAIGLIIAKAIIAATVVGGVLVGTAAVAGVSAVAVGAVGVGSVVDHAVTEAEKSKKSGGK